MNIDQMIEQLKSDKAFLKCVTKWQVMPKTEAQYAPFPSTLDERLIKALKKKGIHALYTHQEKAFEWITKKQDTVIVTPTASGKTLCYNLPVLDAILKNNDARALYLFPTKALSSDQVASLYELIELMGEDIKAYTYDGDTNASARKSVRQAGHVVVTNPDMLHSGILPHHTKWVKLFENLQYIVIDEIHSYRGVFGSNLANVLRRLIRLCDFYNSHPTFILCSATIQNKQELAETLIGRSVKVVDQNGAPMGEKNVVLYNPPVVNEQLLIRKSALSEAKKIAYRLLQNKIQSIVFLKSRLQVEVLTKQMKAYQEDILGNSNGVRGYRGGYLPSQRRDIEKGLRNGSIDMVLSTNALELGIDIGALEACLLVGYPGTIASTWQQAGRAGRRNSTSLTILVATSNPLDQFIVTHPDYFFGQPAENALINPDNLYVMLNHLKCSAYELPFKENEHFSNAEGTEEMLSFLTDANILRHVSNTYHWMAEEFPASEISLRSAMTENFLIMDITDPKNIKMVGEMDRFTVPMLLHENAIYMHEGVTYQVEKLDFDSCKAFIKRVQVDYYTDADLNVSIAPLDTLKEKDNALFMEIKVTALVRMFKKMQFDTGENLGFGPVMLPETEMHTTAVFWMIKENIYSKYQKDDLQNGMVGITNLLSIVAPLYLMCAQRDIAVTYQVKNPFTNLPTIILYDNIPGGVGLSEKAFSMRDVLLNHALMIAKDCACPNGCPSCVGPMLQIGKSGKKTAITLLGEMLHGNM